MSYLLDTNVLSELVKAKPDKQVLEWFAPLPNESLYISVLSVGEIRKGVEGVKEAKRREKLRRWLELELPAWFSDRLLPVDTMVAERWGRLLAEVGRSMPAIDSLIAATALHHDFRLVTRNESDFTYPGLQVVNPWNLA